MAEGSGSSSSKENVSVTVRFRPSKAKGKKGQAASDIYRLDQKRAIVGLTDKHPTIVKRNGSSSAPTGKQSRSKKGIEASDEHEFIFDALHMGNSTNKQVYQSVAPVVEKAMEGYNATIFAYGQTASGKTHTMVGSEDEPGVIPLAVGDIFEYITAENTRRSYTLRCSHVELYNENLRDLLVEPGPNVKKVDIVQGENNSVVMQNVTERPVTLASDVLEIFTEGDSRRKVGATDFNEHSSRSHSIFQMTIESIPIGGEGEARAARVNLIDLAGSESGVGQAERMMEGKHINKSLLTLSKVIASLTEPGKGPQHIPYRDSKLTRLLQADLGGNSRVSVICTVSPDEPQASESLNTLKFAQKIKMVETRAKKGVVVSDDMLVARYAKEVKDLQRQMEQLKDAGRIATERDQVQAQFQEARGEIAQKDKELARLKLQLEATQSFILTGPTVEANKRRASGRHSIGQALPRPLLDTMMEEGDESFASSSRGSLGMGTPRSGTQQSLLRVASERMGGSSKVGSLARETDLEKQLEAAQLRVKELQGEMEGLVSRAELEEARKAETSLRSQLEQAQEELDASRKEKELHSQMASEMEESKRELERLGKKATQKLSDLEEELGEAKQRYQATVELLQTAEDEKVLLSTDVSAARTELAEAEGRVKKLQKEVNRSITTEMNKRDEITTLKRERDAAVKEAAESRRLLEVSEKELREKGEKSDSELRRQIAALQGEAKEAKKASSLMEAKVVEEQARADRLEKELGRSKSDALEASKAAEAEKMAAGKRISELEAEVSALRKELSALRSKLAGNEKQLSATASQLTATTSQLSLAEAARDGGAKDVAALKAALETLKKAKGSLLDEKAKLEGKLARLEEDLARRAAEAKDREAATVASAAAQAKQHLEAESRLRAEMKAAKEQAEAERQRFESTIAAVTAERDTLQHTITQAEARKAQDAKYRKDNAAGAGALKQRILSLQSRGGAIPSSQNTPSARSLRQSTSSGSDDQSDAVQQLQSENSMLTKKVDELQRQLNEFLLRQASHDENTSPEASPRSKLVERQNQLSDEDVFGPHGSPKKRHPLVSPSLDQSPRYYPFGQPPPLPCSPRQRELDSERRYRRQTLERDMANLRQNKAVESTVSKIESPRSSPTKPSTFARR